ncbi:MAG: hypothetical protein EOP46_12065 [Sphingobacteriaceae bacterium]|nr:MAG: hypothetical protein EOP46_12065 [Sphingobacteriaceae bacterium]
MTTAQIKQHLHNYIDTAGEAKIKAIYTLLQDDINKDFTLTDEQKAELDRRLINHKAGIGMSYTLEETIENARLALKTARTGK